MKIYTHQHVDLDNSCCLALLLLHYPELDYSDIIFVPANWDGEGLKEEDIAIDIWANGKGMKGDGKSGELTGAAFTELLNTLNNREYNSAYSKLNLLLKGLERYGHIYHYIEKADYLGIWDVWKFLRLECPDDAEFVQLWYPVIGGMLLDYKTRMLAKTEAKLANTVYDKIAILKNSKSKYTGTHLFRRGALFVIYEDGNNLSVKRCNGSPEIHVGNHLKEYLPDWFHHPDGFFSAWGSPKAPATEPPAINAEDLAELLVPLTK